MNKLPEKEFFDSFYIWFNSKEKKEYYSTPSYLYAVSRDINYDKNTLEIKLIKDIQKYKPKVEEIGYKHPATISFPIVHKYGNFLMDLLNMDLTSFETAYNTFFYKYGFEIILDMTNDFTLLGKYENEVEVFERMKTMYIAICGELEVIKEELQELIEYVFNTQKLEKLEGVLPAQRFAVFGSIFDKKIFKHIDSYTTISERRFVENMELKKYSEEELLSKIKQNEKVIDISQIYMSNNLVGIAFATLKELFKDNIIVKKCINCGMYFIPSARIDELYCEYPKIKGKTCRELGAISTYTEKLKKNKALGEYRRIYQQKTVAVSRNKDNIQMKADFEQWKKQAKEQVNLFKRGKITEDEIIMWLNNKC